MNIHKAVNKRGFTLIEVCLVLVVMGIIVAAVVPSFGILYEQSAKRFADTFLLDMEKQRAKGRAMPKVGYYIKLVTSSGNISVDGKPAQGFCSYIVGNKAFGGEPETDKLPAVPSVAEYTSKPYTGTHPKVAMGMLIDGIDAAGKEVYFDGEGAYTLDPSGNKQRIKEMTLGISIKKKKHEDALYEEVYIIKINGMTGKTTWTIL